MPWQSSSCLITRDTAKKTIYSALCLTACFSCKADYNNQTLDGLILDFFSCVLTAFRIILRTPDHKLK